MLHYVGIIIGGGLLNDDAWLQMGEEGSNIKEKVITSYVNPPRDTECLSVFSPNAGKYGPE